MFALKKPCLRHIHDTSIYVEQLYTNKSVVLIVAIVSLNTTFWLKWYYKLECTILRLEFKLITVKNASRAKILNFLNVALLSKWCQLMALWMLIMIKTVFWSEVIIQ